MVGAALLILDLLAIAGSLFLMTVGSGFGNDLIGTNWGGQVVWLAVAGAFLLPIPLVLVFVLLGEVRPHGVNLPGRGPRTRSFDHWAHRRGYGSGRVV